LLAVSVKYLMVKTARMVPICYWGRGDLLSRNKIKIIHLGLLRMSSGNLSAEFYKM
jgi:hypothetical protein